MSRKGNKQAKEASSPSDLVVEGILEVGTSADKKSKKKWKKRLICIRQMKESGQGLLEVYTNPKVRPQFQTPSGVILLTPDVQVYLPAESNYPNVFVAEGPDTIIFLAATSQEERASWMNTIQGLETFKEGKLKPNAQWFTVKGVESEHMKLIGCPNGDCILAIDRNEVQLACLRSKKFIVRWPLHCLRRYVCEADEFKLFTGRRAPRGEGEYAFRCANADKIYATLEMFISVKAKELQQQQGTRSDSLENRPPAPLPTPNVTCPPSEAGNGELDSSVKYHEITSDLVPNHVHASSGDAEGYARTQHDLGPQFNRAGEGEAVAMGNGLYNTLQHMDKEGKSGTWRTARIDSKSTYEMAKPTAIKGGPDPIYNVAYPNTSDPRDIPKANTLKAQASQLSPGSHAAMNPAYQSLGETMDDPKPHPPASGDPKEYKSSLLGKPAEGSKVQRSYSLVKKEKMRVADNDHPHRPPYLVTNDSDQEDEAGSPPSVPPRRQYTKSECAELELTVSGSPSEPSRTYTKSECDELALSSTPEVPPRTYTNASSFDDDYVDYL